MNGVLGQILHFKAILGRAQHAWANEMTFVMNQAHGAGSLPGPVEQ